MLHLAVCPHNQPYPPTHPPPSPTSVQVRPAIEDCTAAGIRVVVITGDNKLTAEAICRKIGVFEEGAALGRRSMTGMTFAGLPESERRDILAQKVRHCAVMVRICCSGRGCA